MKLLNLIFALGLAAISSVQVNAGITLQSANPADNSMVKSLSKINTTWYDDDGNWLEPDEDIASAVVKDSSGATVAQGYFSMDWNVFGNFIITISPTVTEQGECTVEIGDNVFQYFTNTPAVLHYTVGEGQTGPDFVFSSADPASGSEVNEIGTIETYWSTTLDDYMGKTSVKPYIVDADGETVATGKFQRNWNVDGEFNIVFSTPYTVPGEYEVVLPANAFEDYDGNTLTSNELRLSYTIVNAIAPTSLSFERAYPANNSEVTSLSEIKLYWYTGNDIFTLRTGTSVSVEDQEGTRTSHEISAGDDNNQFIVTIDPEITEAGLYKVFVPANIFLNADGVDVVSPEITLYYTVKPLNIKVPYEAEFSSSTPEDGARVMTLKLIQTYWNCNAAEVSLDAGTTATVTKRASESEEEDEIVANAALALGEYVEGTGYLVTITLENEISANGEYLITVPANFLLDEDGEPITSDTLYLTIYIESQVSVETIKAESSAIIYDLHGNIVKGTPAKGIYVMIKDGITSKIVVK